jgi:N-acetylneuraminate lyase
MDLQGSVRRDRIPELVEHLIREGIAALYVGGSTGEGVSLTTAERMEVAEAFVAAAARRIPVLVQVGHNSLREARLLAEQAQRVGADAISAAPPSYFRPASSRVLLQCLQEIAAGAPELPLYYYHIPGMTGVQVEWGEFLPLAAAAMPSLVGAKYTSPDLAGLQHCLHLAEERFEFLYGGDEMLLPAFAVGVQAAVGSTYNFAAPLYLRILQAFKRGDLKDARCDQARSVTMVEALLRNHGNAGLKAAMQLIGVDCGPPRLPQCALTAAEISHLEADLRQIGFFDWARS